MSLRSADRTGAPTITVEPQVLAVFDRFRQRRLWHREAGGQLFARFAGANTLVVDATSPGRLDKRNRFGFSPHLVTQQKQIRGRFTRGLHFIGDWHSHPEDAPRPSALDISSMRDCLTRSRHDLKALLLIVVGRESRDRGLWVGTVSRTCVCQLSATGGSESDSLQFDIGTVFSNGPTAPSDDGRQSNKRIWAMAVTHHFNQENDLSAGGIWFDDYGREICRWSWNSDTKTLTVTSGAAGHSFNLSKHDEHNVTPEKLKQRLPDIAISTAEDLNKQKYRN